MCFGSVHASVCVRDAWAYSLLGVNSFYCVRKYSLSYKTIDTNTATLMTTPTLLQILQRFKKIYMIDDSDEVLSFKNLSQHNNSLFAVYSSLIKQGRLIFLSLLFGLQQHRHKHLGIYVVEKP